MICTPSEIYQVDQIENDELGGPLARMLNVTYNKMIFCVAEVGPEITMVFMDVGLENVNWIDLAQDKVVVKTAIERRG